METLVLTVIGDDRPGLVSELSETLRAHGASWDRGQMARLAGKFAGILLVTAADGTIDALTDALRAAPGLHVTVERTQDARATDQPGLRLHLLGADRPGIVAEISRLLAARGIGIEELVTDVQDAPMAGGTLFRARAVLSVPPDVDQDELRTSLEAVADELMVDIDLSA